ncbi:MAG: GltB/FmdC/FwdC-like GXGXG domain-containing protein [Candidatus Geothermincolia bacterium]
MAATAKNASDLKTVTIDAGGIYYKQLNEQVRELALDGVEEIILNGINGQRYIGDGLTGSLRIVINGVPGNDLAVFMNGPTVVVNDNAQDGVGNTMNSGKVVVNGNAGDVIGYGMRGGKVFVSGNIGYRVGIHMKSFKEQVPAIVAGGRAGDFFGEYMAGGRLVLLGMGEENEPVVGSYVGTGMHGGAIYLRGEFTEHQLGREVREFALDDEDRKVLTELIAEFSSDTGTDVSAVDIEEFKKLQPFSHRPYGNLYCY